MDALAADEDAAFVVDVAATDFVDRRNAYEETVDPKMVEENKNIV